MPATKIDARVIEQFRAGEEPRGFHRDRLVLLTTVGAKTGQSRTSPMMFIPSPGGIIVIASANASPEDPRWFHNLEADPHAHVELADEEFDADATVLSGERREREWAALVEAFPFFAEHQAKVERQIPMIELTRV
ncbi:nitroreductase/quinone reductase family protein [soil metagenome]